MDFGIVETFQGLGNTYVFSQACPSWTFVCDGLGLKGISTYMEWHSPKAQEEFKSTPMEHTLASMQMMTDRLERERTGNLEPPLVFIQGSAPFVACTLQRFAGINCHSVCAMVGSEFNQPPVPASDVRSINGLHWREDSHKSLAGATSEVWWFRSLIDLASHGGIDRSRSRRTLHHVLRSTEHGRPRKDGQSHMHNMPILTGSNRAWFGCENFGVESPCVFAPSSSDPLVVRDDISYVELMDIYDLDCITQHALNDFQVKEQTAGSRAFVHAAPQKVLFMGAQKTLAALSPLLGPGPPSSPSDNEDDHGESDDGITIPDISLQSELGDSSQRGIGSDDGVGSGFSSGGPPHGAAHGCTTDAQGNGKMALASSFGAGLHGTRKHFVMAPNSLCVVNFHQIRSLSILPKILRSGINSS